MTAQKAASLGAASRRGCGERLKDEVYRQMFRLEARHPGADRDLAVALLRAWIACGSPAARKGEIQWLKKICPICLGMIDDALQAGPRRLEIR
jgi:hypothetical protein